MNTELILVRIDSKYCDYLRKFDNKVPYNNGEKELRLFVGILFEVNSCKYFAPLSCPKPKHLKMNNKPDFLRLESGKLGAINFNNMLPVYENNIVKLDLDKDCLTQVEQKYQKLLKKNCFG